ncbi:MAG: trimeric autotransporter adhesin [Thermoanaerobaculia bacterium]|jgi:uncharacterized repeat protein (TIGR01451 family)|nr:trimeric autotransporter adhesin [Thermoanaerobaculia bacterium]
MKRLLMAMLFTSPFAGLALAQALPPTITKNFSPSTVFLNGNSDSTITVANPNSFPITNVQFNDTMPAGVALITQVGGTCSTLATGGGMFTINPGAGTFSSTSNTLTAGQSCTIVVRVKGTTLGPHLNTTSQVTATGTPAGGPASATLTVIVDDVPALSSLMLFALAAALAGMAALKLRA